MSALGYDVELVMDDARRLRIAEWVDKTCASLPSDFSDSERERFADWLNSLQLPRYLSQAHTRMLDAALAGVFDKDEMTKRERLDQSWSGQKAWATAAEGERISYFMGYFDVSATTAREMVGSTFVGDAQEVADSGADCALYRHYDANGTLLYVGISRRPTDRMEQHRAHSAWLKFSARHTVDWYSTEAEAREAERLAILADRPLFNRTHNRDGLQRTVDYLLALAAPRVAVDGGAA